MLRGMSVLARPVPGDAVKPAWPPTAPAEGAELSLPAVLAILVAAYLAMLFAFAAAARGTLPYLSPYGSAGDFVTRQLIVPSAIVVGMSVGLVLMLRWQRVTGLGLGRVDPWGTVPLAVFAVATVVTLTMPNVSSRGPGFIGFILTGLFLAALSEEIVFRGFLLHGLGRRMGGRDAVLLGSALFSAGHVPSLLSAELDGGGIAISLVVLFGLGVLLCRIRVATGSIWFASGVHTLWNFVTVAVVGFSTTDVPIALALLKLVPIVIGLKLAAGLSKTPRLGVVVPSVPATALAGPGLASDGALRPFAPIASPIPAASPWVVRSAAEAPSLPPPPPPPRPDP
jgi:membrane protease YdiL (CAAX protease family)